MRRTVSLEALRGAAQGRLAIWIWGSRVRSGWRGGPGIIGLETVPEASRAGEPPGERREGIASLEGSEGRKGTEHQGREAELQTAQDRGPSHAHTAHPRAHTLTLTHTHPEACTHMHKADTQTHTLHVCTHRHTRTYFTVCVHRCRTSTPLHILMRACL